MKRKYRFSIVWIARFAQNMHKIMKKKLMSILTYMKCLYAKATDRVKHFQNVLKNPALWQGANWTRKHTITLVVSFLLVQIIGAIFNAFYPFPLFIVYVGLFSAIFVIALLAERKFTNVIEEIRGLTRPYQAFDRANNLFIKAEISNLFITIPIIIVLIFGIFGLLLYDELQITPTLVWCLAFFVVVVYLSIIGYLQYVMLFIYIKLIAYDPVPYKNLIKASMHKMPAEVDWLQKLTKISHLYRTVFFSLGSLFIIAFAIFCYYPAFAVTVGHPFFYILWLIILIAIVIVFPMVSCFEFYWIKKIVKKIKNSYINDLVEENRRQIANSPSWIKSSAAMTNWVFAVAIQNTNDYPVPNLLSSAYAFVLAILNLSGSIYAIAEIASALSGMS